MCQSVPRHSVYVCVCVHVLCRRMGVCIYVSLCVCVYIRMYVYGHVHTAVHHHHL